MTDPAPDLDAWCCLDCAAAVISTFTGTAPTYAELASTIDPTFPPNSTCLSCGIDAADMFAKFVAATT